MDGKVCRNCLIEEEAERKRSAPNSATKISQHEEQNSKLIKMPSAAYLKTESYANVDKNLSSFALSEDGHAPTLDLTSIMPYAQALRFGSFEAKVEVSSVTMLNEFNSSSLSLSYPLVSALSRKQDNESDFVNVAEMTEDKGGLNLHDNFESAAILYAENQREFFKTAVKELTLDDNVISENLAIENSVRSHCDINNINTRHENDHKKEITAGIFISHCFDRYITILYITLL